MSGTITITVIGAAGLIGKRHVEHIRANPRTRMHSVVDPTPAGADLASTLGVPVFETLDSFIASFPASKPHGAVIATPSHLHVEQALQLVGHGIHLLIEKPVCIDVASGKRLLQAASAHGSGTVLSGYHRRFNPYIIALKDRLDSGNLGRVLAVQGTWAVRKPSEYFSQVAWRTQKGSGGTILTNMSHEIDLFRYLFGEITRVYLELGPNLRGYDVDETGAATIRFASGTVGTYVFSDNAVSPFSFEGATGENPTLVPWSGGNVYRILATKGSIELPSFKRYYYSGVGEDNWSDKLSVDEELDPSRNFERFQYTHANAPFTRRLEHWADVIEGVTSPNCTLRDGVMATAVLDALVQSGASGMPVNIGLEYYQSSLESRCAVASEVTM